MRVITGSARGRNLETLKGDDITRPTSQMIKEAMFSAVQFHVEGARALDLFAGSGQLGIEALSRGAALCVFVDSSRDAVEIIKKNLQKTKLYAQARVIAGDAGRYLLSARDTFDLVFLDPPYRQGIVKDLLPLVAPVVSEQGFVLCEAEAGCAMPETVGALVLQKVYRHGQTSVWLYKNATQSEIEV